MKKAFVFLVELFDKLYGENSAKMHKKSYYDVSKFYNQHLSINIVLLMANKQK